MRKGRLPRPARAEARQTPCDHQPHVRDRRHPRSGREHGGARGRRHGRGPPPPRAGRPGRAPPRGGDAGPYPAGDHRRGRRGPAAGLRGRRGDGGGERRDLQPRRAARRPRTPRAPLRHRLRQRGDRSRLRGARARLRARAERHLRLRPVGRPRAPAGGGTRPLRREAALLVERRPPGGGGLRGRSADLGRAGPPGGRPRGARPLPGLSLRARSANPLRGREQAAAGLGAHGAPRDEQPRVTSFREAPGPRRWRAGTTSRWPTSWPSASPRRSGAR